MEENQFMTLKEFCALMRIGKTKAHENCRAGYGFAFKFGGRWYIDRKKFQKWIDKSCSIV